jgi:polysaccharide biosynthesis protein PslL
MTRVDVLLDDREIKTTTELPNSSVRLAWIDVARGLGIILVVFGHENYGRLTNLIYVFHMPLFFYLSGYLHKPRAQFRDFFIKRSINLLLPYVVVLSLIAAGTFIHHSKRGTPPYSAFLWGGDHLNGIFGVAWFITCLFLTQQIANVLLVVVRGALVFVIAGVALTLACINQVWFPTFTCPWDANVVMGALPFFLIGYASRKVDLDSHLILAVAIASVIIAAAAVALGFPISMDMRSGHYGIPIVTPTLAVGLIAAHILVSRLLSRLPTATRWLGSAGTLSIGIMFIHKVLPGIPIINKSEHLPHLLTFVIYFVLSYLMALVLSRFKWSRALLLGSERDLMSGIGSTQLVEILRR